MSNVRAQKLFEAMEWSDKYIWEYGEAGFCNLPTDTCMTGPSAALKYDFSRYQEYKPSWVSAVRHDGYESAWVHVYICFAIQQLIRTGEKRVKTVVVSTEIGWRSDVGWPGHAKQDYF